MKEKIKSKLVYAIIIIMLIFIGINIAKIRRLESYEQDILARGTLTMCLEWQEMQNTY